MQVIRMLDLFAGGGGFSDGFKQYLLEKGIPYEISALNHDETAIETYSLNHPESRPFPLDIYKANPRAIIPGGELDLLIGSPECTFHSKARKPGKCDDQSRCQAFDILRWAEAINIRAIVLENVEEFVKWGPLDKHGMKIKERAGEYFVKFLKGLVSLGYDLQYRFLTAANYGAWTSRTRFFLIARKDKQRIDWPSISHARNPDAILRPWKPAREIIDWNIKGDSIFRRQAGLVPNPRSKTGKMKIPLSENTIRRICYGLNKFSGLKLDPYIVMLYGQSTARSLDLPLPTITAPDGHLALCTPFLTQIQGTSTVLDINSPLGTVTTKDHFGLVQPFLISYHNGKDLERRTYSVNEPIGTIDTNNRFAICEPFICKNYSSGINVCSIHDPLDTVTTKDRFSLIQPFSNYYQVDILYRMLEAHELAAAMGFRRDYKFAGNITQVKKQIGNAVEVNQARALASVIIPSIMVA